MKNMYNQGTPITEMEYQKLKTKSDFNNKLLYVIKPAIDPHYNATCKWCSLSNAIINKYKPMSETNPECVITQLQVIKDMLIEYDFLQEEDFKNWGE